jgi:ABC-type multidrug transport system fused ATPase/permease subunit
VDGLLRGAAGALLAGLVAAVFIPVCAAGLVDRFLADERAAFGVRFARVAPILLLLVGLTVAYHVARFVAHRLLLRYRWHFFVRLKRRLLSRQAGMHDSSGAGPNHLEEDLELAGSVSPDRLLLAAQEVLLVVGLIVFMLITDVAFTALLLLGVFLWTVLPAHVRASGSGEVPERRGEGEQAGGFRALTRAARDALRRDREQAAARLWTVGFLILAAFGFLAVACWRVLGDHITPGESVLMALCGGFLAVPAGDLWRLGCVYRRAEAAAVRVFSALGEAPLPAPRGMLGRMVFDRVTVRSGGLSLEGVSFVLEPGAIVAICDREGGSTDALLGVVSGRIRPAAGHLLLANAGGELRELDLHELRHAVAVADGRSGLAAGSLEENIVSGRTVPPMEEVVAAAEEAGVTEFLPYLSRGLDSVVAGPGAEAVLSPGQRHRILLARALLGHPGLLVLRDLFEGIDADSRAFLWNAVAAGRGRRATLVLTSTPELPGPVDRLLYLNEGRLAP